jgi:DNA-binding CsgD family transcriptional regulator
MSPSRPSRRPWTADEQKKLDDLTKGGKTAPEIATALQRTPQSIYSQLQRLDIKRRKAARLLVELGLKATRT